MLNANQRISTILQHVSKYEASNLNVINNQIINKALAALEESIRRPDVREISFNAALKRLRTVTKSSGDSTKDPLTQAVLNALHASRDELDNLSQEQKEALIQLTAQQREQVKSLDQNLKKDYLKKKVEVHEDAIEENPIYKEVLARMQ